ncbi:MAG: hypothetical protein NWR08_07780, partial [Opitutales bacterium]|nr:hypothetical protein [Opitutales bacterium]
LLGKPQESDHDYVIINNGFKKMARTTVITRDGWKLVEVERTKDHYQLYNIIDDNEERHELSAKYPEKVAYLKKILLSELDSERPDLVQKD